MSSTNGQAPSVDRVAIGNFTRTASTKFGTAVTALNEINRTAKSAVFTGANANTFKLGLQTQLSGFTTETKTQIAALTDASNRACRAIGASLGEDISTVEFTPEDFKEEAAEGAGGSTVTVDYASMEGVRTSLVNNITIVQSVIREYRNGFAAIPWTGRAKAQATNQVTSIANKSIRNCTTIAEDVSRQITAQIESTDQADRMVGIN